MFETLVVSLTTFLPVLPGLNKAFAVSGQEWKERREISPLHALPL